MATGPAHERVEIAIPLEQDEDGFPPMANEYLWAEPLADGNYRLASVPWFARPLAVDDVVRATRDDDGGLRFVERLHWAGHLTIRVAPNPDGPAPEDLQPLIDAFATVGVRGEGAMPAYPIVALDIPPDADLPAIKALLLEGEAEGRWYFEEGCVGNAWIAL
jgi:hypothetical protein